MPCLPGAALWRCLGFTRDGAKPRVCLSPQQPARLAGADGRRDAYEMLRCPGPRRAGIGTHVIDEMLWVCQGRDSSLGLPPPPPCPYPPAPPSAGVPAFISRAKDNASFTLQGASLPGGVGPPQARGRTELVLPFPARSKALLELSAPCPIALEALNKTKTFPSFKKMGCNASRAQYRCVRAPFSRIPRCAPPVITVPGISALLH